MKRILSIMAALIILMPTATAHAASVEGLYPKLIVEDYILDKPSLTPGEEAALTIVIRNTNSIRSARNIRLSFEDAAHEILPVKTASAVCPYIGTGDVFEWRVDFYAVETAKDAPHILTVKMEYEDKRGNVLSAEDTIIVDVVQPVRMEYTEPELPPRATQGDTFSFSMTLMNMGKGDIYNALLSFDVEGIASGGSVLVGTIAQGESKEGKTNFRVGTEMTGEAAGCVTLSYEDSRGKYYETVIPVSTVVAEKAVKIYNNAGEESAAGEDGFPWKTLAIGFGGLSLILVCSAIIISAKARKIRREYEMKL
jgi:hypothetical protein